MTTYTNRYINLVVCYNDKQVGDHTTHFRMTDIPANFPAYLLDEQIRLTIETSEDGLINGPYMRGTRVKAIVSASQQLTVVRYYIKEISNLWQQYDKCDDIFNRPCTFRSSDNVKGYA